MLLDNPAVIAAIFSIVSSTLSSITTWLLAKKKYNTEVRSNELDNLVKSLEFYKSIVKDHHKKLNYYIDLSEKTILQLTKVQNIVRTLLNNSCLSYSCLNRESYSEEQIKDILGKTTQSNYEEES